MSGTQNNKKWDWINAKDQIKNVTGSVLGVAAFTFGVLQVFNPIVVAATAGVYATYSLAKMLKLQIFPKNTLAKLEKDGFLVRMDQTNDFSKRVQEMAKRAGLKTTPTTYYATDKEMNDMVKSQLPPHLKWLYYIKPVREKFIGTANKMVYAAMLGAAAVLTTEEALHRKDFSNKELDFIVAHETGHLKADGFLPSSIAQTIIDKATTALLWTTLATGAVAMAGVALPFAVSGLSVVATVGALVGIRHVAKIGPDWARRTVEKRADRNAVYLTRNAEAGKNALTKITTVQMGKTPSKTKRFEGMEWFVPYPSLPYRLEALQKSFDKASTYPEIADAVEIVSAKSQSPTKGKQNDNDNDNDNDNAGTPFFVTP